MTLALRSLDPCVHCGFCLQSCPTYLVTSDEADGPRGRIGLMQDLERGRFQPTDLPLQQHLDRCLGCRACETACPSGVGYGVALEDVRAALASSRPLPWPVRIVNTIMANRILRRVLLGMSRAFRPLAHHLAGRSRGGFLFGMLGATKASNGPQVRTVTFGRRAETDRPMTALFTGCVMDGLFGHVHRATERVLTVNGYHVINIDAQQCCGALHTHSGDRETARRLAQANVEAFASLPTDATIVVNSAGCGAALREYPHLFDDQQLQERAWKLAARVRDVSELLAESGPVSGRAVRARVVYDPPCHLQHAQRINEQPLAVLGAIPDLEMLHHDEADRCCGSAGSFTLAEPAMSQRVLQRKLEAIRAARPDIVLTGNPGCIMQIGGGLLAEGDKIEVMHPVELLDRSYAAAGLYGAIDD